MINFYLVKLRVNGFNTFCTIVGKEPITDEKYFGRIKRSYYNGVKNIKEKDKFEVIGFEVLKKDIGNLERL